MTTIADSDRPFLPGMGVDWLLPLYDPITRLLGLDRVRRELLADADLWPGHRVLDIGCGTGSLAVALKQLYPGVEVVGLDPDPKALARAGRKARRLGLDIRFDRGFSDSLHYPEGSFDRVLSSFMFHHLQQPEKQRTAAGIRAVVKPGGSCHLIDFAGRDPSQGDKRAGGLDGHTRLAGNDEETVLGLLRDAGFADVAKTGERVVLRSMRVVAYRARVRP